MTNAPTGAAARAANPTVQYRSRFVVYLNGTRSFWLPIGPEETQQDDPSRSTVVDTLAGAYQEAWGAGVGTIILSGTTGWAETDKGTGDGFALMQSFVKMHRTFQNLCATTDPAQVELILVVPPWPDSQNASASSDPTAVSFGATDTLAQSGGQGVFRISSDSLRIDRSKQSPLLFRYRWSCTILEDKLNPRTPPGSRFTINGSGSDTGGPGGGGGGGGGGGLLTPLATAPQNYLAGVPAPPASRLTVGAGTPPGFGQSLPELAAQHSLSTAQIQTIQQQNGILGHGRMPPGATFAVPPELALGSL